MRVKAESLTWNSDEQHQFYVVNLEGGNPGFDVLMLDVIWVPEFAARRLAARPHPVLAPDELAAYFPAAVARRATAGVCGRCPWTMNVGLLYYRKDLLDKYGVRPPESYAELIGQVDTIKAESGILVSTGSCGRASSTKA